MCAANHLKEAKELYQKAVEEFNRAKEKGDSTLLRDACAKGWLSAVEATQAIFTKKGVKEEELPKADRGRRFMVYKYVERDLSLYYFSLRESLHIEGYYNGSLEFNAVKRHLEDLNLYIQKVEGV